MKLIEPKYEIIPQSAGIEGMYRQIEIAGRTCYKSEDKITADSAKAFVQKMIDNGHTAMLEHGTVYLKVPVTEWQIDDHEWGYMFPEECPWIRIDSDGKYVYVTTNYRHIINGDVGDKVMQKYICEPTKDHTKRITVRFTCDRGVSHELVRHRVFSFAQESTRYCNYSKDRFGNELTFIIPSWLVLNEGRYTREATDSGIEISGDGYLCNVSEGFDEESLFLFHLLSCESRYMKLIDSGWTPQQARAILPNALKTEVVMTGFEDDWKYFFKLRCAPNAHPDMRVLAEGLNEKINCIG